ncbi:hypothetical protein LMG9673_04510 [Ralstonia pseudosolanacearum]|nr:hypothetical protein LMG9673_04510 [Ralstonia pseudosolanacearum]
MGIIPSNTGGFGDVEKAAKVFARNEVKPLQDRLLAINEWMGRKWCGSNHTFSQNSEPDPVSKIGGS